MDAAQAHKDYRWRAALRASDGPPPMPYREPKVKRTEPLAFRLVDGAWEPAPGTPWIEHREIAHVQGGYTVRERRRILPRPDSAPS